MTGEPLHVPNAGRTTQILTSVFVGVVTLHAGMNQGWQSPMSLKLLSDDSPVEILSEEEVANLASVPSFVGLIAAFVISFIAQKFGRKVALCVIGVGSAIGGGFLTFAPTKVYLYVGRVLTGIAGSGVSVAPMFISETVHESIRGTLMAMCTFQLNAGILVAYTAGAKLPYKVFNAIFMILPVLYTFPMIFLPETPLYLADKSRPVEAQKSMTWYRGGDQRIAEMELERLASSKNENEPNLSIGEILKSKITRMAMIISVSGYIFQTLSGIHAILNYSGNIFEESGSVMSAENSSIIISLILLASSVVNVLLMDRLGRKPLLYISFIGSAIGMAVLTIFLFAKLKGAEVDTLKWIPIASMGLFVFTYGVGLAAVPGALVNEVSPTNIRPAVVAVVMIFAFSAMMVVLQTFPYMKNNWGLYSVFVIPAVANVAGLFFAIFVVPETKGKSFEEIEEELKNR